MCMRLLSTNLLCSIPLSLRQLRTRNPSVRAWGFQAKEGRHMHLPLLACIIGQKDTNMTIHRNHISPASGTPRGIAGYRKHCIILTTAHSGVILGPASTPMLRATWPLLYSSGFRVPSVH